MRYFVPDIRVGSELRKQTALEDKFGGLPWGLRAARWPRCAECRKSMSFLAQLLHHPVRLDLGREGRVLFAFQCDGVTCATYEGSSGANACFVSEPEWLTDGPSARPMDRRSLEHEVRVARWDDRDDGVPDALMPRFFDYDDHLALDDGIVEQLYFATRLGSAPAWIQAAQEPPPGFRFVGQLDAQHWFYTPPRSSPAWVRAQPDNAHGITHGGDGPNFGDVGRAFLFVNLATSPPKGFMLWQCH